MIKPPSGAIAVQQGGTKNIALKWALCQYGFTTTPLHTHSTVLPSSYVFQGFSHPIRPETGLLLTLINAFHQVNFMVPSLAPSQPFPRNRGLSLPLSLNQQALQL